MRLIGLPFLLAALALAAPTTTASAAGPTLPTTTTLSSAAEPANQGDSITLTAVVDGPGWPGGDVTFSDYELGPLQSAPVQEGKATAVLPPMSPGLHLLSADYSGDGTFAPSSARLTQRVGPPVSSTVLIGADHNPTSPGQGVTLTAGLQTSSGYGVASGTVTLMEGGNQLATLPVSLLAAPAGRSSTAADAQLNVRILSRAPGLASGPSGSARSTPILSNATLPSLRFLV